MMDDQPQQPIQQEAIPQPPPQPRKKRTATRLKTITEQHEVEFNNAGQHSGEKQNPFANDCGVLTRRLISIKYSGWKDVPESDKEHLWLTIKVCYLKPITKNTTRKQFYKISQVIIIVIKKKQKRWTICDENRRKSVLKSCNQKWRTYKKSIKKKLSINDGDPRETWSYLEEPDLQIFRQRISTDEFQVLLYFSVT
jgi:hypothetical protein